MYQRGSRTRSFTETERTRHYKPVRDGARRVQGRSEAYNLILIFQGVLSEFQAKVGDRADARAAGINLQAWRARCLHEVAGANADIITEDKTV